MCPSLHTEMSLKQQCIVYLGREGEGRRGREGGRERERERGGGGGGERTSERKQKEQRKEKKRKGIREREEERCVQKGWKEIICVISTFLSMKGSKEKKGKQRRSR